MTAPARSRLARIADFLLVVPPAPVGQARWRWLLWPFGVLLGMPGWPQNGGLARRLAVFSLRVVQGPTVRLLFLLSLALASGGYLLYGGVPPVDGTHRV